MKKGTCHTTETLLAQGFSKGPVVDFHKIFSLVNRCAAVQFMFDLSVLIE